MGAIRLGPRRHDDLDLLLWGRRGTATVVLGRDGATRTERIPAGRALLVPRGLRHVVTVPEGCLLHPVTLPVADAGPPVGDDGPVVRDVPPALAAAVLALSVAQATDLRPPRSRLLALREHVRRLVPDAISAHDVSAQHIEWVANTAEHVLVLACHGAVTVVVEDEHGTRRTVELREHMALGIPPRMPHRILARDGIALPVFHRAVDGQDPGSSGAELLYLPAAVRLLAEHHMVAGCSALRPPRWDDGLLPRALAGLVQRAVVLRADGGPVGMVDRLREQVIRDPAAACTPARCTGEGSAEAGVRRSRERRFRRTTGTGFVTWRQQVRAEQAEDLLRAGRSVKSVARQMGFAHASGFSRAFAATTGRPPRAACA